MKWLKSYWVLILILIVATWFRWADIGAEYIDGDDAYISLKAIGIARYGRVELLGPPMAVGAWHSPFSVYLYAAPYLFSPDQRVARMFKGLVNVIAIALMYVIGARYFDRNVAFVSAWLYAIQPYMLTASRSINNAQLGAPFVMLYVLTGLLGYYEKADRRWARVLHLPMLSLAGQCHPHTFAIAPVSLLFFGYAWTQKRDQRRALSLQFVLSGLITIALMIPWGIGFYQFLQSADLSNTASTTFSNKGLLFMFNLLYKEIGGANETWRFIHPTLLLLSVMWIILRTALRRVRLPEIVFVPGFFLMPLIAFAFNIHLVIDYFWNTFPIAFLLQGVFVGGLFNQRYLKWGAYLVVALLTVVHVHHFAATDRGEGQISLNAQLAAMEIAQQKATGREILVLVADGYDEAMPWNLFRESEILKGNKNVRVIVDGWGLPIPNGGAVVLISTDYNGRATILPSGVILNNAARLLELPSPDHFYPEFPLAEPLSLHNGATVLGFKRALSNSAPVAGQKWSIFLVWRVDRIDPQSSGVFAHLLSDRGEKIAQRDVPTLREDQQRVGETVLSQIDFDIPQSLPTRGPLYLRFGMRNTGGQIKLANGEADFGVLQIRGNEPPLLTWENGLILDRFVFNEKIPQGPPIDIEATWFTAKTLPDLKLRLVVKSSSSQAVLEKIEDLKIPPNVFLSRNYQMRIPTDIAAGIYTIEVSLADSRGEKVGESYKAIAEVTARTRKFDPLPMQKSIAA